MEKQNTSEDSSANKSPSSPSDDTRTVLNPASNNMQGESIMKTAWQVLEELGGDDDSGGEGGVGGEAPVAAVVAVGVGGGGGSTAMEGVVVGEGIKKRKVSEVRDPPSGKPTCPVCHKEFPTWKGAFGHMRAHPDRDYRGFFKPPVFGFPSSTQDQPLSDNKGDGAKKTGEVNVEKGSASLPSQMLVFDLNEPMEEAGSSHAAEPAEEKSVEEGKGLGFDLNEMPPPDDYDL